MVAIQEEKKEDPLATEEETAIAAMLSLKASPTGTKKTASFDSETDSRPPQPVSKLLFHNNWDTHHQYGKARFGLRPRVPEYYHGIPRPPTLPHHYNGYSYATAPTPVPRYVRYDYE